jgi:hypothetical protein
MTTPDSAITVSTKRIAWTLGIMALALIALDSVGQIFTVATGQDHGLDYSRLST